MSRDGTLPPGVEHYMIDGDPCRCDTDTGCVCECEHGYAIVTPYEVPGHGWFGLAVDGCVVQCRCADMCVCGPDDFPDGEEF